jgi:hypothetical protein
VDLTALPLVGVGSVCRRQDEAEIGRIVSSLAGAGSGLHGFGVKKTGLGKYGRFSGVGGLDGVEFCARRDWPLPGCTHKSCANCARYALRWRAELLAREDQMSLEVAA